MKHNAAYRYKGFTLIEVLIVVAISGLLLLSLSKITLDGIKVYKKGIVQTEMKSQIRKTMDMITSDLRQANTASGWVKPTRTDDMVTPQSELIFRRYVYKSDNESTPTSALVKYKFEIEPGNSGYYMLTREVTDENNVVRYGILADGLKFVEGSDSASHFRWNIDGMNSSKADINSLLVVLVMERFPGNIREEIRVQTAVAIRSEEQKYPDEVSSGYSKYYAAKYGVFMDSPSSLVDPRED